MEQRIFLEIQTGEHRGKRFFLQHDTNIVGNADDCQIQIESTYLAAHHAKIEKFQGQLFIEDLRSGLETFVNQRQIATQSPLYHDDIIKVAHIEMIVKWAGRCWLEAKYGEQAGVRFPIDQGQKKFIGRDSECEIFLYCRGVSRRHAVIEYAEKCIVSDFQSTFSKN